ncbi:hypothetical protein P692DRAFT_201868844 [Suillus brevipes Sb2]|nr:hypothetical protein P692DRAFT_201868844 [Suillus brevipes Sb2]
MPAGRPIIHTTPQAKLRAAREKRVTITLAIDVSVTLSDCLEIVIEAKNELVVLASTPVVYVEAVLHKYIASVPDHNNLSISSKDGDASIIEDAIQAVKSIHEKAHCGQDKIWEMCRVCDEWRAADEVC